MRSLQAIGVATESYGSFLAPVVMAKIPEEMRIAITRKITTEQWDIESILGAFREEVGNKGKAHTSQNGAQSEPKSE